MFLFITQEQLVGLLVALALLGTLFYIIIRTARRTKQLNERTSMKWLKGNGLHFKVVPEQIEILANSYTYNKKLPKDEETGEQHWEKVQVYMSQIITNQSYDGKEVEFHTPIMYEDAHVVNSYLSEKGHIDLYVDPTSSKNYVWEPLPFSIEKPV